MSNITPDQSFSGNYPLIDLLDPRSPTTAFQRTPIQVILNSKKSMEESSCECGNVNETEINSLEVLPSPNSSLSSNESLETKDISSSTTSYLSSDEIDVDVVDLASCDPSPIVSDFNISETVEKQPTKMEDTLPETPKAIISDQDVENAHEKSFDNSFSDSFSEPKIPAKKLFYTPNKKRTPLLAVDNICPVTPPISSPQNVLRQKQWKRIQEERKKLGIEADENLPLPLNDVTASAPSKLMLRKKKLQARFL